MNKLIYNQKFYLYGIFRFFRRKEWKKNANQSSVQTIYRILSQNCMNVCPCVYIIMFGIFRLANFGGFSNLYFYNMFPMKTNYFKKNVSSIVELTNIKTAYLKYERFISKNLYIKLCTALPESTLCMKRISEKIFKKNGAEQVRRMLSKCYSKNVNVNENSKFI